MWRGPQYERPFEPQYIPNSYESVKAAYKTHRKIKEWEDQIKKEAEGKKDDPKKKPPSNFSTIDTWMMFMVGSMLVGPGYNLFWAWAQVKTFTILQTLIAVPKPI